ncbi:hypothetical protein B0H13DRAFT_1861581 [Mycena leptocephala]|nr:hypothetical protein B0H13DRAFT_1861581 [Mycena leptocephala]
MYDYIKLTQTCRASDDRLADGKQLLGDLQSPGVGRRQQVVNKQEQLRKKELGTSYKGARGFKSGKPRGVMGQSRGVSRSKAELHKMRGLITQDAGEPWTGRPFEWLRAHIRAAFVSLVEKYFVYGGKLATYETLTYCPDLGLCATNWKVDALATEVYSQWSRYHRDEIQSHRPAPANTNTNGKRKSGESESSIASKKRKPDSSVSKASTKTASTKTTKKRTRKASPTSAPNTAPVAVTFASDTTSPANSSPMVSSSTASVIVSVSTASAISVSPASTSQAAPSTSSESSVTVSGFPASNFPDSPSSNELPLRLPSPLPPTLNVGLEDYPDVQSPRDTHSDPVPPCIPPAATAPATKIVNPLIQLTNHSYGLLGRASTPHVSRIKDVVRPEPGIPKPPPAPVVEAQDTPGASSTDQPNVSASTEAPDHQKKPPHRPGVADTAWNLFGREHMKISPKDITSVVQTAFAALTPDRLK